MKKVPDRIQFWRDLGFFEKYRKLTDEKAVEAIVRISEDSYWGELSEDMEELDLAGHSVIGKKESLVYGRFLYIRKSFPECEENVYKCLEEIIENFRGRFSAD